MVSGEFPPLCVGLFAGSLLIEVFLSGRTWKNRDLKLFLSLLLDSVVIVILPVTLLISAQLTPIATQELFLSGFFFYLAVFVIYLLFTSSRALSIPFASLFLLFAGLQSFLALCNDSHEFRVTVFAYNLIDETALAAFCALCLAVASPLYRQISHRVNTLLDTRHLSSLSHNMRHKDNTRMDSFPRNGLNAPMKEAPEGFLPNAVKYLRKREYGKCIEFCDAEAERMMLSRLLDLYPAKTDIPTSLQGQIEMIESKGTAIPSKSILRLRNLRNALTMSSEEATIDQAKWAIRVVRRVTRVISSSDRFRPQYIESRQLERVEAQR